MIWILTGNRHLKTASGEKNDWYNDCWFKTFFIKTRSRRIQRMIAGTRYMRSQKIFDMQTIRYSYGNKRKYRKQRKQKYMYGRVQYFLHTARLRFIQYTMRSVLGMGNLLRFEIRCKFFFKLFFCIRFKYIRSMGKKFLHHASVFGINSIMRYLPKRLKNEQYVQTVYYFLLRCDE